MTKAFIFLQYFFNLDQSLNSNYDNNFFPQKPVSGNDDRFRAMTPG